MGNPQPSLELASRRLFTGPKPAATLPERLMSLDKVRELYQQAKELEGGSIHDRLLESLQVTYHVQAEDLSRVPPKGPVIVVANHPFGMLEGPILGSLMPKLRPDVKVMTNYLLSAMPELAGFCIFVDPFGGSDAARANLRAMKEAIQWMKKGGMLVIFPAGEVSHWSPRTRAVEDPEWSGTVARLIEITGAGALPMYFEGSNSLRFQLLGMIHPRLRTASLANEFLNKRGARVDIRFGRLIGPEKLAALGGAGEVTEYLRWRTYLLGERGPSQRRVFAFPKAAPSEPEPVIAQVPPVVLAAELSTLPPESTLESTREFSVHIAGAEQIPNILREIGRLRELTFRAAGEGTGRPLDLDRYDAYYEHLFVWNQQTREVAGAYRLARTDRVAADRGVRGLYSRTLFQFDKRLLERMGPALELGRSFVRPEYQRQFAPLLLLWKGIGRYVARYPETATLFGAVSISADYSEASRELLVRYFQMHDHRDELSGLIKPKRPYRTQGWDRQALSRLLKDLDDLAAPISDLERDGKGIPVLVRQYAKLGGRILGFSVDPGFGNCVDGLILVDLRKTDRVVLERYLSREGASAFLAFHQAADAA
ncbi:MAG: lysophospholipid acyltransferase family protein [Bryobacteraceae bacterium]